MKVKAIMIPFIDLKCISVDNTIEEALKIIDEHQLLSMPVVNGKKFIGVLSKHYVYEQFFQQYEGRKEEFLQLKVMEMMRTRLISVDENAPIEEVAALFISSKFRFVPVLNKQEELLGIVTQQAIFKEYHKLFGKDYNTFTIYTYDYKGTLAKIAETIARHNGDIKNIVAINTETMGLQEIFVRVACEDFGEITRALTKRGFDVRIHRTETK